MLNVITFYQKKTPGMAATMHGRKGIYSMSKSYSDDGEETNRAFFEMMQRVDATALAAMQGLLIKGTSHLSGKWSLSEAAYNIAWQHEEARAFFYQELMRKEAS